MHTKNHFLGLKLPKNENDCSLLSGSEVISSWRILLRNPYIPSRLDVLAQNHLWFPLPWSLQCRIDHAGHSTVNQWSWIYTFLAEFPIEDFDMDGALCPQFGFNSRGLQLHILGWSACVLYSSQFLAKRPFLCECLGQRIAPAELKCEKRKNLKL